MADRTAEARNGREEEAPAAGEAEAGAPEGHPASPLKSWLPLIVTVVLMPVLAFATTRFVLVPQMRKAMSPSEAAPAEPSGTNVDTGPALIDGKPKVTVQLQKI